MDVYQGKMNTISPAFGSFDINVYLDIDTFSCATGSISFGSTGGFTGMAGGVTGMGTLVPINWGMGITGLDPTHVVPLP